MLGVSRIYLVGLVGSSNPLKWFSLSFRPSISSRMSWFLLLIQYGCNCPFRYVCFDLNQSTKTNDYRVRLQVPKCECLNLNRFSFFPYYIFLNSIPLLTISWVYSLFKPLLFFKTLFLFITLLLDFIDIYQSRSPIIILGFIASLPYITLILSKFLIDSDLILSLIESIINPNYLYNHVL